MSVRCPKCRKRHDEPYPKRCGCGESLVTLLAGRRESAVVIGADQPLRAAARAISLAQPAVVESPKPAEPAGNEW